MKPEIPKHNCPPSMNITSKKNFIKSNIKTVKNLNSTKPFENQKPFTKNDYGEIPYYLDTIKAKVTAEKDYFEMLKETQKPKPVQFKMDDDMRKELLDGLKNKYDLLSEEYQVGKRLKIIPKL